MAHVYEESTNGTDRRLATCNAANMKAVTSADEKQEVQEGSQLVFTYDVIFTVRLLLTAMHATRHHFPHFLFEAEYSSADMWRTKHD